jgi:hypothetical protein
LIATCDHPKLTAIREMNRKSQGEVYSSQGGLTWLHRRII